MDENSFVMGDAGIDILSLIIATPLLGAFLLYLLPFFSDKDDTNGRKSRVFSLIISLVPLALSFIALAASKGLNNPGAIQFVKRIPWIPQMGISFFLGIDGISFALVLLTVVLMPLVILSATVNQKFRGFFASLLVVEAAMIGTLLALDLFLFYMFWELMLAPMYFLIGIWGGNKRINATLKFVVYTVIGSVLMLVAILYLVWSTYRSTGVLTFALDQLHALSSLNQLEQIWLFSAFAIAFAIKVPIFPFHTWMADVYTEAPTAALVVSSGIMIKLGLYGLIRFACPLFPIGVQIVGPVVVALAIFGILYGALVAWRQGDLRRLLAFSSLSHLGFCVLGVFAFETISLTGAVFQSVCHGITAAGLFILLGILTDQRRTRDISEYGGLTEKMPRFAFVFLIFTLSSVALPLTNSFVGEFLILIGSFKVLPLATALASLGVIFGAVYMLSFYQKLMFGRFDESKNGSLRDLTFGQSMILIPLMVLVFYLGIFPSSLLTTIEPSVVTYRTAIIQKRPSIVDSPLRSLPVPSGRSLEARLIEKHAVLKG
jgi:NADH-quinone oxidoreductase subunit M